MGRMMRLVPARTRIGLSVSSTHVRAVATRSGRLLWCAETERIDAPLAEVVSELLRRAPITRRPRAHLFAAIGPARGQLRKLTGLPAITDGRVLDRVIAEDSGAYFVRNGNPLVTSRVRLIEPGVVWAAAFERADVDAVLLACRTARIRARAVLPSASVLTRLIGSGMARWPDGAMEAVITACDGELVSIRRSPAGVYEQGLPAADDLAPRLPAGLAPAYADAYAATLFGAEEPLDCLRPNGSIPGESVPLWRAVAAVLAFSCALIWALAAPGVAANRASARAAERLAVIATHRAVAIDAERELVRHTSALAQLWDFGASRRSTVELLAELASALPDGAAIVNVDMDTAGGTMAVLGAGAARVLAPLERSRLVASPEIIGPITREIIDDGEAERLTIRFRHGAGQPAQPALRAGAGS